MVAGCFLAAIVAAFFAWPLGDTNSLDWLMVGYLGVFQIGLAYALVTRSVRQLPAIEASLLFLAEPAFAPVWAWLLLAEKPGTLAILGGAADHSCDRDLLAAPRADRAVALRFCGRTVLSLPRYPFGSSRKSSFSSTQAYGSNGTSEGKTVSSPVYVPVKYRGSSAV